MARTLADYLSSAGVSIVTPEVKTAKAKCETKKEEEKKKEETPAPAPAPVKEEKETTAHENKETPVEEAKEEKGAAVQYDPAYITTAEQKWLLANGIVIPDAKIASVVYQQHVAQSQQVKMAELEALAEEERSKGALQYHGMLKESTAMRLAEGEATINDVVKVASWIGVRPEAIIKRAEELAAAATSPALVADHLGTAARNTSAVQAAAEQNANTTEFRPEAASGTRGPVRTQDEKLFRFTDTMVLPGNPGLDKGMTVNQGKGFNA